MLPNTAPVAMPSSMDSNWACAEAEAVLSQSRLSRRSQSAEAIRLPSDDEDPWAPSQAVPSPVRLPACIKPRLPSTAPWWVHLLREISKACEIPGMYRSLNVMSACTGVSAESFSLEARSGMCAG